MHNLLPYSSNMVNMKHIEHLEASISETIRVHAGTLSYKDQDGTETEAEFYVRTCADDSTIEHTDGQARGDRQDDLNEQYTDVVSELMEKGCTDIHYKAVQPDPFF